mmetsp:Transcript_36241/g.59106  ORF Transcript_36241/g.59106 Transcript_36241/m.59106 type:complete len:111 (-) Transcript_36241:643-975(-)
MTMMVTDTATGPTATVKSKVAIGATEVKTTARLDATANGAPTPLGLLPILSSSVVQIPPVRVLASRACAALNGDTAERVPTTAAWAAKMNRASIRPRVAPQKTLRKLLRH